MRANDARSPYREAAMPLHEVLAARLDEALARTSLSNVDIGKAWGVDPAMVTGLRGAYPSRWKMIMRLDERLAKVGLDGELLAAGDGEAQTVEGREAAKIIDDLSPEAREAALQVVRLLSQVAPANDPQMDRIRGIFAAIRNHGGAPMRRAERHLLAVLEECEER